MVEVRSQEFDLQKIADSGQCFRLTPTAPGRFQLVALGRSLLLESTPSGVRLDCSQAEYRALWQPYFDLNADYGYFRGAIPAQDTYLTAAAEFGRGIRILRQEPWEMLVTFLLSQRRNIPAIRRSVELLCRACGRPLAGAPEVFAFPEPQALAALPDDALAGCSLGYRAPYVRAAAQMASDGRLPLDKLAAADDETLCQALRTVPGVGPKVANCVMLFGFHRLSGFPIDVWMERVLREHYSGGLDLSPYAGFEGVIQQYLFFYAREHGCPQGKSAAARSRTNRAVSPKESE